MTLSISPKDSNKRSLDALKNGDSDDCIFVKEKRARVGDKGLTAQQLELFRSNLGKIQEKHTELRKFVVVKQTETSTMYAEAYKRIMSFFPNSSMNRIIKAEELLKENKYDQAEVIYKEVVETEKATQIKLLALHGLAEICVNKKKTEKAISIFQEIREIDKNHLTAQDLYFLAKAYKKQNKPAEACKIYEEILNVKEKTHSLEALNYLADFYKTTARFEKAAERYAAIVEIEPRNVETLKNLAGMYYRLGNAAKAVSTYEAAKSIEPTNIEILFGLAHSYQLINIIDPKVQVLLDAIIKLDADNITALGELGKFYSHKAQAAKAAQSKV